MFAGEGTPLAESAADRCPPGTSPLLLLTDDRRFTILPAAGLAAAENAPAANRPTGKGRGCHYACRIVWPSANMGGDLPTCLQVRQRVPLQRWATRQPLARCKQQPQECLAPVEMSSRARTEQLPAWQRSGMRPRMPCRHLVCWLRCPWRPCWPALCTDKSVLGVVHVVQQHLSCM